MGSKWEIKLSQLDVQTMQGVSQPRPEQESVLLHAQQQVALQQKKIKGVKMFFSINSQRED
ncbi:Splicing factor U2af large subunit B [Platanthera zijinensis]|uniref:Splicing factor U2af large subunit B n=1 Tax=Platanthera zijinensis TaxID=2320716 RepID=A0AAP0BSG3_9ASPA